MRRTAVKVTVFDFGLSVTPVSDAATGLSLSDRAPDEATTMCPSASQARFETREELPPVRVPSWSGPALPRPPALFFLR